MILSKVSDQREVGNEPNPTRNIKCTIILKIYKYKYMYIL